MSVDVGNLLSVGILVFLFVSVGAMALMGRATNSIAGAFVGLAVVCISSAVFIFFNIRSENGDATPTFVAGGLGLLGLAAMYLSFELAVHRAKAGYEQIIRQPDGSTSTVRISHSVQGRGAHESHTRFNPQITDGSPPQLDAPRRQLPDWTATRGEILEELPPSHRNRDRKKGQRH